MADHFSALAAQYAQFRPHYPDALVDVLADRCEAHAVALDLGCGSGQLSCALARRFARVIGTDPSAAQLAAATPCERVEYHVGRAEQTGLSSRLADLAVAAQAAHWFRWPAFLREVERVTKRGALIALVSYGPVLVDGEAGAVLAHYYRDVAGPYWPPERVHVENGYRDLALPWPAVDAPQLAMRADWSRDELVGYVTSWSATGALVAARGPGPVEDLRAALAAAWPGDERREIRWPLTVKLARR